MEPCQTGEERALLTLDPRDDVAVALRELSRDEVLTSPHGSIRTSARIERGHKVALRSLACGEPIRKYGEIIGHALEAIAAGAWVHTHNIEARPFARSGRLRAAPVPQPPMQRTFQGYARQGRRAGVRNTVAVIATVNCSADAAWRIAGEARSKLMPDYPNVSDVFAVTHRGGCGIPTDGLAYRYLERSLAGMATHPNVAAALVVGLGCEVMQGGSIVAAARAAGVPCEYVGVQECGGVGTAVRCGLESVALLMAGANQFRRTALPLAELVIGTNCGGSDAFSGITANPLLGLAGDAFCSHGASWVLAESPETYGAEHLLAARAVDQRVADRLYAVMSRWEDYAVAHGAVIDNNPAPGNKAGGISTIYEKALGAVTKGGSSPLRAVLDYGEQVTAPGLLFMDTPGMDDVSVTGLVAGGCNLIAFTTGRGSCLSIKPVPVLKIASTSKLFAAMLADMDFDAEAAGGSATREQLASHLVDDIIAVASGRLSKGEEQDLGAMTFAPWDVGPTL